MPILLSCFPSNQTIFSATVTLNANGFSLQLLLFYAPAWLDKTKFYVVGAGIFTGLTVALYPISVVKTRMQVATRESIFVPLRVTKQRIPSGQNQLDKTKFYVVGAGIFTSLTIALYLISVVKTRMQVATKESVEKSAYDVIRGFLKADGVPGLYRGFGTVITRAVPARIIFLTKIETTKVAAFKMVEPFKLLDPTKAAIANGLAGMTTSLFSQGVFVPIDVLWIQSTCYMESIRSWN
nr:solute carrier family 25 member 44 [Tanacetum cinerariifolium]